MVDPAECPVHLGRVALELGGRDLVIDDPPVVPSLEFAVRVDLLGDWIHHGEVAHAFLPVVPSCACLSFLLYFGVVFASSVLFPDVKAPVADFLLAPAVLEFVVVGFFALEVEVREVVHAVPEGGELGFLLFLGQPAGVDHDGGQKPEEALSVCAWGVVDAVGLLDHLVVGLFFAVVVEPLGPVVAQHCPCNGSSDLGVAVLVPCPCVFPPMLVALHERGDDLFPGVELVRGRGVRPGFAKGQNLGHAFGDLSDSALPFSEKSFMVRLGRGLHEVAEGGQARCKDAEGREDRDDAFHCCAPVLQRCCG